MITQTKYYALFKMNNTVFRPNNTKCCIIQPEYYIIQIEYELNMTRGAISAVLTFAIRFEFPFEPDPIYIYIFYKFSWLFSIFTCTEPTTNYGTSKEHSCCQITYYLIKILWAQCFPPSSYWVSSSNDRASSLKGRNYSSFRYADALLFHSFMDTYPARGQKQIRHKTTVNTTNETKSFITYLDHSFCQIRL